MIDDKNDPIRDGWTRITVHLAGTMHEIQLVSDEMLRWIEVLEDELSLEHLRGTADGADRALAFAQQAGRRAVAGDVDTFGSAWGVSVVALWMYLYPSCPIEGCQNREQLSELIQRDGGAHLIAACSEFSDNKWIFDLRRAESDQQHRYHARQTGSG
jgi:hypothetical protein